MAAVKRSPKGWTVHHAITGKKLKDGGPFKTRAKAMKRAREARRASR